jgi:hypothetical protein
MIYRQLGINGDLLCQETVLALRILTYRQTPTYECSHSNMPGFGHPSGLSNLPVDLTCSLLEDLLWSDDVDLV